MSAVLLKTRGQVVWMDSPPSQEDAWPHHPAVGGMIGLGCLLSPFLCLACLLASPPFCIPMACHGGWRVGEARALPCRAVPGRRGGPCLCLCGGGGGSIHILRLRSFRLSPSSPVTRPTTSTPRSAGQARAGMGGSGCPEHLDPFIVPTEIGLCPPLRCRVSFRPQGVWIGGSPPTAPT